MQTKYGSPIKKPHPITYEVYESEILSLRHYKYLCQLPFKDEKKSHLIFKKVKSFQKVVQKKGAQRVSSQFSQVLKRNSPYLKAFIIQEVAINRLSPKDFVNCLKCCRKLKDFMIGNIPPKGLRSLMSIRNLNICINAENSFPAILETSKRNTFYKLRSLQVKKVSLDISSSTALNHFYNSISKYTQVPDIRIQISFYQQQDITFWKNLTGLEITLDENINTKILEHITQDLLSIREMKITLFKFPAQEILPHFYKHTTLTSLEIVLTSSSPLDFKQFLSSCSFPENLKDLTLSLYYISLEGLLQDQKLENSILQGENIQNPSPFLTDSAIINFFSQINNIKSLQTVKICLTINKNSLKWEEYFISWILTTQSHLKHVNIKATSATSPIGYTADKGFNLDVILRALGGSNHVLESLSIEVGSMVFSKLLRKPDVLSFPKLKKLEFLISKMSHNLSLIDLIDCIDMPILETLDINMIILLNVPYYIKLLKKMGRLPVLKRLGLKFSTSGLEIEELDEILSGIFELESLRVINIGVFPFQLKKSQIGGIFNRWSWKIKKLSAFTMALGFNFIVKMEKCRRIQIV